MAAFRSRYGERPLHLLAAIASFAIAGYAILEIAETSAPISFAIWFVGAIVVHDMIAFPFYSVLGVIVGGGLYEPPASPAGINYLRVPALLSIFLFIVWFPVILGFSEPEIVESTGLGTEPFLGRWLLLTGAMFAISAVIYAFRLRRRRP
jgi:hypothetical protein